MAVLTREVAVDPRLCLERRHSRSLSPTPLSALVRLTFLLFPIVCTKRDERLSLSRTVIGKGGAKINEIRQQSQCQIRVTDPGTPATPGSVPNPEERLVTITGMPHHINTAVSLLYSRLEQEKQKNSPIH